jgi:putative transposase
MREDLEPKLAITRRRLPHWRLEGSVYFVTWRLLKGLPDLMPAERGLVCSIIRKDNHSRCELYAFVVMNDHVHVVLRPTGMHKLETILHTWKSLSAHQLQRLHGRRGSVWLTESWDRIIRDEDELYEKCNYILNNPQKRWPEETSYPYMGTE